MLKHLAFLLPAMMFALPAQTAVLSPYQETGCTYEGGIGKDGLPSGKGIWRCRDGRGYTGSFKNGKFDGQGVYTVAAGREVFLEPFFRQYQIPQYGIVGHVQTRLGTRQVRRLAKRRNPLLL